MKPNQKETLSEDFFTKKIQLEDQLLVFEDLQRKATEHLETIDELASEMMKIAENNSSAYFLQRTKRLLAEIHKVSLKKHITRGSLTLFIISLVRFSRKIELNS